MTLGTLVDRGLTAADADPEAQEEPPDLAKVRSCSPSLRSSASTRAPGQPCFLTTGDPPPTEACSKAQQEQPDFDGTQTYYNSGFMPDGEVFKVKLADDIEPGTYRYFCLLHRAGQQGKITVRGRRW